MPDRATDTGPDERSDPGTGTAARTGLRPATIAAQAGRPPHEPDQPLNTPIPMASTYVAGGEKEYGRYANDAWTSLEQTLAELEGARHCLSFASGMAAITTLLDLVAIGGTVVMPQHAYLGGVTLLGDLEARGRLKGRLVDVADTAAVVAACEGAALVWLESPTNPALEVADIATIAEAAHAADAYVVVDNTFATPLRQQPLALGADLVVHSVTKYLAGHSDVVLGAVATDDDELHQVLLSRRSLTGATPGPFEAWLALRGMRTLHLRVDRAEATARELVARLAAHPAVSEVRYPGFGGIIAIVLAGGAAAADLLTHRTRLWVHATSLGGVESTFERRRRWKTEAPTIPEGLVRMSVGVEDVEDLWNDLLTAFDATA